MGQSAERPSWVDGYRQEMAKSYIMVFQATAATMEAAFNKAVDMAADEQSRGTGRKYDIQEANGQTTYSSQDRLVVQDHVIDKYEERLPSGECRVSLLIQIARNPLLTCEPVSVTNKYPFSARVFVPGMAQLHKGSTTKGLLFIAAEIAAVGGVVAFEGLRSSYDSKINSTHNAKDRQNYINNRDNMQNLRNGFIAGAAAIYLWNVVDGIVAKGKKHVEVGHLAWHISPYGTPSEAGVLLSLNF